MGDISKNFNRHEFACKCGCGFAVVDVELIDVLELVRKVFKKPITINSACRCHNHNEAVQKEANINYTPNSSKSKHMLGIAADIVVGDTEPCEVYDLMEEVFHEKYGVGEYNSFTHIDVRKDRARWQFGGIIDLRLALAGESKNSLLLLAHKFSNDKL